MELFKLFGNIAINNSEANNNIDKTSEKAASFSTKLKKGIGTVAKWGTAITASSAAAGATVLAFATKAASAGDNIDKMSQKIGISRTAYQELDFICSQSGTSVDSLQMGVKSLTAAMDGAASGTASNVEQFEKLGISVQNADGSLRSQEDIMWETLASLQSMENQTEKARLATELFGRSGTELMPLLNGASGSIEEMKQKAHDLGLVMDDEFVDSSVEFTDTIDQLKRSTSTAMYTIGGAFLPIIQRLATNFVDAVPKIQEFASGVSEKIGTVIDIMTDGEKRSEIFQTALEACFSQEFINKMSEAFPRLQDISNIFTQTTAEMFAGKIGAVKDMFSALDSVLQPIVETVLTGLMHSFENIVAICNDVLLPVISFIIDIFTQVTTTILTAVQPAIEVISSKFQELQQIISDVIQKYIIPLIQSFISMIQDLWAENQDKIQKIGELFRVVFDAIAGIVAWFVDAVKQYIVPFIEWLVGIIRDNLENIKGIFQGVFDVIGGIVDFFISLFKGDWQGMWDAVKSIATGAVDIVKNIFNVLKNVISTIINTISSVISKVFNGIKNTIVNIFTSVKDTVVNIWNGIWNGIKGVINWILGGIEGMVNGVIRGINILLGGIDAVVSGVGDLLGLDWSVPLLNEVSLPRLAKGGVLEKGQVGLLEGDGAEAVVPLEQNRKWISRVANDMEKEGVPGGKETLNILKQILESISELKKYIPQNENMRVVLESGVLVGEIAPAVDARLGRIAERKGRY